jgi:hypothetical protein
MWWVNGLRHRIVGAAVEYTDGHREWWVNGQRHRLDGPAVEHANGSREWWVNGRLHRVDGAAVEYTDGHREWWVNGVDITREVEPWLKERNRTWPFDAEARMEFQLTWA